VSWTGELTEKGFRGSLRSMSESHDFDPADFQAGAFSVGAEYQAKLSEKDTWMGDLAERAWEGSLEEVG